MSQKLKGCRPSTEIDQDFVNTCAQLGAVTNNFKRATESFNGKIEELHKRLYEIDLETKAAKAQEESLTAKLMEQPGAEMVTQ